MPNEYRLITDDEFYSTFRPRDNHIVPENGDKFETYGAEEEYVRSQASKNLVWTAMDSEDGNDIIFVNGMHHVNRLYYLVCNVPYEDAVDYETYDAYDDLYEYDDYDDPYGDDYDDYYDEDEDDYYDYY